MPWACAARVGEMGKGGPGGAGDEGRGRGAKGTGWAEAVALMTGVGAEGGTEVRQRRERLARTNVTRNGPLLKGINRGVCGGGGFKCGLEQLGACCALTPRAFPCLLSLFASAREVGHAGDPGSARRRPWGGGRQPAADGWIVSQRPRVPNHPASPGHWPRGIKPGTSARVGAPAGRR
jgi:hypothetical protein